MPAAPLPPDETERLAVLHALDILSPDADGMFDRAAALASGLFGGTLGSVAMIDAENLHYKGMAGLPSRTYPRSLAICAYVLASDEVVWIEDVNVDPRTSDLAAVSPVKLGFYAAAPIRVSGRTVGALCVATLEPRPFEADLAEQLGDLAGLVGDTLALRARGREIEAALAAKEQSERRLSLALEISGTGVWELDVANKQLFASGPAMHLLGRPLDYDTVARHVSDLCHPDDADWVGRAWDAHLSTGAAYNVEHRLQRSDGQVAWVHAFAEAIRTPEGRIERIVGAMRDVTARKEGELQLADAIRAAETANLAKSEFLANMSHELRTPLNGITGVTGALSRTSLTPRQAEMVGLVETSADALSRLLSEVLDLARVDSGKLELNPEDFDLDSFTQGVATLFQWRAQDKNVDFRWKVAPELHGRYTADVVRLRQILSNLLSNAVKFTAMGEVRLSVEHGPRPGEVCFVVRDTGIGFTPAQAKHLFERFSQGDGSITRRFGGSGLGLAISRALAGKMGGRLEAHGEPNVGATFTLTLALPAAAGPLDPRRAAAAPVPAIRGKVLLAEDHPINRKVVELILGAAGLQLTSVENGEEALRALRRDVFDIVLMDMQMPVMDGLTAIRALRAMEAQADARGGGRRTPVISLTANALPEHVRASYEAGADEHMTKPLSAALLLERVFSLMAANEPALERAAG